MNHFKFACAVILSLPLLVLILFFDIVKIPIIAFLIFPIFLLIDAIWALQGDDEWSSIKVLPFFLTMGVMHMWWEVILGQRCPDWCNP
jgi:hypothetical protein